MLQTRSLKRRIDAEAKLSARAPYTVFLLAMAAACCVHADTLVLRDGDRFSGRLLQVTDGVAVFKTALSGQMVAPMDTVEGLSTAGNLVVTLSDDRTLVGRFGQADGAPAVFPLQGDKEPVSVDLAGVSEALPIPKPPRGERSVFDPETGTWRLGVGAGAQFRQGERDYADAFVRIEAERSDSESRTRAGAMIERADGDEFPGVAEARTEWVRRRDEGVDPFVRVGVERDIYSALDVRAGLTLGLLDRIFGDDGQRLEWLAGLNAAYEAWDVSTVRQRQGAYRPFEDQRRRLREWNAHLGLRYQRALFGDGTWTSELTFLPSATDLGDFRARSESTVSWPLWNRLRLRFDVRLDYDDKPAFDDIEEFSSSVGASVQVDF